MSVSLKWKLIPPLVGAAVFGLASFILGFGFALSAASALVGAVSGWRYGVRAKSQAESPSVLSIDRSPRGDLASRLRLHASRSDEEGERTTLLRSYAALLIRGSVFQRAASRVLIAQAIVGAVSIALFWIVQASGGYVGFLHAPTLVDLFGMNFPIDDSSTIARARFDNLFVALVLLYGVSLTMLTVAFVASLGTTLRDIGIHWRALVIVPAFVVAPIIMVFHESTVQRSWQMLIVAGDVRGYLAFFVLLPLCMVLLTASLPYVRSR